jgi:prepilin-type N-terminal cleavage/methylation domain-containing protein
MTLIEVLVVMVIVSILAALIVPATTLARDRANTIKCMSNLRGWGQALTMFAEDHNHLLASLDCDDTTYYVISRSLYGSYLNAGYLKVAAAYQCPSAKGDVTRVTLGYPWGHRILEWTGSADIVHPGNQEYELNIKQPELFNTEFGRWLRPSMVVLMIDAVDWHPRHHGKTSAVLAFADGRAQVMKQTEYNGPELGRAAPVGWWGWGLRDNTLPRNQYSGAIWTSD